MCDASVPEIVQNIRDTDGMNQRTDIAPSRDEDAQIHEFQATEWFDYRDESQWLSQLFHEFRHGC
jgi:hypothetical protein